MLVESLDTCLVDPRFPNYISKLSIFYCQAAMGKLILSKQLLDFCILNFKIYFADKMADGNRKSSRDLLLKPGARLAGIQEDELLAEQQRRALERRRQELLRQRLPEMLKEQKERRKLAEKGGMRRFLQDRNELREFEEYLWDSCPTKRKSPSDPQPNKRKRLQ